MTLPALLLAIRDYGFPIATAAVLLILFIKALLGGNAERKSTSAALVATLRAELETVRSTASAELEAMRRQLADAMARIHELERDRLADERKRADDFRRTVIEIRDEMREWRRTWASGACSRMSGIQVETDPLIPKTRKEEYHA